MQTTRRIALIGLLIFPALVRGAEITPDPFLGRWVLDVKASRYPPQACPQSMTIEMTQEARGVHYHSETQPAKGDSFQADYVANYNGKPAMVTGDRGILLPVTLKRETSNHVTAAYANAFQVVATSDRTVSVDGKTMTIVTISRDSLGQTQTNTGIYRRVETP